MSAARKNDIQHDRLRRALLELSLAMAGTSILICSVVGGIIHLYAIFLAFQASGYVAALLTFVFPFFAELYWIVIIWSETGVFWHGLTVAYFLLCVMAIIASSVAASAPD